MADQSPIETNFLNPYMPVRVRIDAIAVIGGRPLFGRLRWQAALRSGPEGGEGVDGSSLIELSGASLGGGGRRRPFTGRSQPFAGEAASHAGRHIRI